LHAIEIAPVSRASSMSVALATARCSGAFRCPPTGGICPQGQFFSKFSFAKQKKFCQNKKNKKIKIKKPLKIAFLGVFLLE